MQGQRQLPRAGQDGGVAAVRRERGGDDVEPVLAGGCTVGVNRHDGIGVRGVADRRALVDAGPEAGVAVPGQHDLGALGGAAGAGGPVDDVPGEGVLGVARVGLRTRGVAGLAETTGRYGCVEPARVGRVAAVVARVQHDGEAGEPTTASWGCCCRGGCLGGRGLAGEQAEPDVECTGGKQGVAGPGGGHGRRRRGGAARDGRRGRGGSGGEGRWGSRRCGARSCAPRQDEGCCGCQEDCRRTTELHPGCSSGPVGRALDVTGHRRDGPGPEP